MRALGGRARPLRRRLRRIALAITAVAFAVGLPLGVLISNLIARMVLQEFVGVTPDLAIDWWVVAASAIGAIVGARLVAARAAARHRRPLAEAFAIGRVLYGHSVTQRLAVRVPTGGLFGRLAARASIRRPARTIAILVQIAAAVAAAFLVPSLVTSVNGFNDATTAPWTWESLTEARDPGLPFEAAALADRGDVEAGVYSFGEIDDWEVDVFGFGPDTKYFRSELREREVAVGRFPRGDAQRRIRRSSRTRCRRHDHDRLGVGPGRLPIVGTARTRVGRCTPTGTSRRRSGAPGGANVIWSSDPAPSLELPVATTVTTADELAARAGRAATRS